MYTLRRGESHSSKIPVGGNVAQSTPLQFLDRDFVRSTSLFVTNTPWYQLKAGNPAALRGGGGDFCPEVGQMGLFWQPAFEATVFAGLFPALLPCGSALDASCRQTPPGFDHNLKLSL